MTQPQPPSVGRIVHYVSYGTPGGECPKTCCAAVITGVSGSEIADASADLCVLNPTGVFFRSYVLQDERPESERSGGTWHWPERV